MAASGNYFSDGVHEWDAPTLWAWAADSRHPRVHVDAAALVADRQLFADWEPLTSFAQAVAYYRAVLAADLRYPIILTPAGDVADGYHRVAKVLLAGGGTLPAIQLAELPPPDREVML